MKTALFALALLMTGVSVAGADPWDHRAYPPPPPPAYGAPYPPAYGDRWGEDHDRYRDDDRWRDQRGFAHDRYIRRGDQLTPWQVRNAIYVGDFARFRLPFPPRGAAWMRLGDRVLLVRQGDWIVLDVFRV